MGRKAKVKYFLHMGGERFHTLTRLRLGAKRPEVATLMYTTDRTKVDLMWLRMGDLDYDKRPLPPAREANVLDVLEMLTGARKDFAEAFAVTL